MPKRIALNQRTEAKVDSLVKAAELRLMLAARHGKEIENPVAVLVAISSAKVESLSEEMSCIRQQISAPKMGAADVMFNAFARKLFGNNLYPQYSTLALVVMERLRERQSRQELRS